MAITMEQKRRYKEAKRLLNRASTLLDQAFIAHLKAVQKKAA